MEKAYTIIVIVAVTAILAIGVSGYTGFSLGQRNSNNGQVLLNGADGGASFSPVIWNDPEKPMMSWPLKESEIPKKAIRIETTIDGFVPCSFQVKAGEEVILAVSNTDDWTHSLRFKNEILQEVAIALNPKELRVITFYAPKEKGEYEFYCDMPGHYYAGEIGKMIVK